MQMREQFRWCANGGEEGLTKCYVLLSEDDNSYVGYLGLTLISEELGSAVNAYVAVEFVYLDVFVRRRGLSRHFIDFIIISVKKWLDEKVSCIGDAVLRSASNLISDGGERFVRRLEEQLSAEARSRRMSFTSCIEDAE